MADDACPVCPAPSKCRGYPHLWKRLREDRALWLPVHERVNRLATPYPSLATQAASALAAARDFLASGLAVVDADEQARRMDLCEACEHFDAGPKRCIKCGCFAALKTRIESQHCPVDRW